MTEEVEVEVEVEEAPDADHGETPDDLFDEVEETDADSS